MRKPEQEWDEFRDRHAAWLARRAPAGDVYALPGAAIDSLDGKPGNGRDYPHATP
jgi:hypothetical protein